jgi:thioesterase domain-containing protein
VDIQLDEEIQRQSNEEQLKVIMTQISEQSPETSLDQLTRCFSVYQTNVKAMQAYWPEVNEPLFEGPVLLLRATDKALSGTQEDLGWGQFVSSEVVPQWLPGDHHSVLTEPALSLLLDLFSRWQESFDD